MALKLLTVTFKSLHHLAPTALQPHFIFFFLGPISSPSQASFLFLKGEGFVCISCSLSLDYSLHSPSYHSGLTIISPPQRGLSWPPSLKELSIPFLSQNPILILCTTLITIWYFRTSGSVINSPAQWVITLNITSTSKRVTYQPRWPLCSVHCSIPRTFSFTLLQLHTPTVTPNSSPLASLPNSIHVWSF